MSCWPRSRRASSIKSAASIASSTISAANRRRPSNGNDMADTPVTFLNRLCLRPDEDAWKRFVDLYAPLIRGWLGRYSVSDEDAEDLAQEVLAVVVRELPSFEHNRQRGAFRSWLRTVAVNQLRVLWRSRR